MAKQKKQNPRTSSSKPSKLDSSELSSQDPAEGRPDVPQGNGADKGRLYDTDKYYQHIKSEPTKSTDDPAEGPRVAGKG